MLARELATPLLGGRLWRTLRQACCADLCVCAKASRSLFRELESTVITMKHSRKRCVDMQFIVLGTSRELEAAVECAERTLSDNQRMVAGTKVAGARATAEAVQWEAPTAGSAG